MKRALMCVAALALFLCGCSHTYVMKLNSGLVLYSSDKPQLKGGFYHYTDLTGRPAVVRSGNVREIEPASMAKKEQDPFKPQSDK